MTDFGYTCHARGCNESVPRRMLMCCEHWLMVPKVIQNRVGLHYVAGQGSPGPAPTVEWRRAADDAIAAVSLKEAGHRG